MPKVGEEAGGHLGGMVEEAGGQLAGQLYINQNKHVSDDEYDSYITGRFCVFVKQFLQHLDFKTYLPDKLSRCEARRENFTHSKFTNSTIPSPRELALIYIMIMMNMEP